MQNFSSLSFDVTTQGAMKVFKKCLKNLLFIKCLSRPASKQLPTDENSFFNVKFPDFSENAS